MAKQRGKLIVIEGSDGSGKATQAELLRKYCTGHKMPVRTLSFPQYYKTFFGKTIGKILRGEFGDLKQINPYLVSMVYAMDRAEAKEKMNRWLNDGKRIILDRYVPSNIHQCGRLPKKEWGKYMKWLDELEYKINNVPREDIVVFLHVPFEISVKLMENKHRGDRAYTKGRKKDIVEENIEYLRNAEKAYVSLAKRFPHWVKIECIKKGELRTREDIHEEIVRELHERRLL